MAAAQAGRHYRRSRYRGDRADEVKDSQYQPPPPIEKTEAFTGEHPNTLDSFSRWILRCGSPTRQARINPFKVSLTSIHPWILNGISRVRLGISLTYTAF